MKTTDKATARPLKIHKSIDPTWQKFSVSMPGIANTQWFDTEQQAAEFITGRGFRVFNPELDGNVTITKAEHAALLAVAEAAHALMMTPGVEKFDVPHYKLAVAIRDLAAVRDGKAVQS